MILRSDANSDTYQTEELHFELQLLQSFSRIELVCDELASRFIDRWQAHVLWPPPSTFRAIYPTFTINEHVKRISSYERAVNVAIATNLTESR